MVASDRKKWFALALILAVQFMVILDIAIVNVALPSIQVDLGFSQENLQWVISAYALVFGGFLLLGGRSADLLGRRRIFIVGTIIFTLGSLLCGFAWSEASLIASRAFQGLGAATHHAGCALHPRRDVRRGARAQHRPGRLGRRRRLRRRRRRAVRRDPDRPPVVGVDLLRQRPGRRRRALILAPFLLSESLDKHGQGFDIPGAVLVTSGLSLLVLGITQGHGWGWSSGRTIGVFVASRGAARGIRRSGSSASSIRSCRSRSSGCRR